MRVLCVDPIFNINVIHKQARHPTERDTQPLKSYNHQRIIIKSSLLSNIASKPADSSIRLEDRISLTVKAYKNGHFKSIQAAAAAYNVPHSTLAHRINGQKARSNIPVNYQKLTNLEEASLKKWILDIDDRGLPPTQDIIHKMADLLLSQQKSGPSTSIRKN
jgi:hypothetical protein